MYLKYFLDQFGVSELGRVPGGEAARRGGPCQPASLPPQPQRLHHQDPQLAGGREAETLPWPQRSPHTGK